MTDVPAYKYINACPWSGAACDCTSFPWLDGKGQLPAVCGKLIQDKLPAMIPFRKLLPSSNGSGQLPPQAANGGSNPSGSAKCHA
jgi:hypothetical protein